MQKRGAIGLSINLLVVIIISLVILSGGIALMYKFIGGAEELQGTLDAQTQAELERLLMDEGKRVALPKNTATIYRGENHVFGIGILNIGGGPGDEFEVSIALSGARSDQNIDISPQVNTADWFLFNSGPYLIEENQHHAEPILVSIPKNALKGTYIFNVKVDNGGEPYGYTKKIYVTVK